MFRRAKGIIAKPMPSYWYGIRDNMVKDEDDEPTIIRKQKNLKIAAAYKPYFMTYVYPALKAKNNTYNTNSNRGALMRFASYGIKNLEDLYNYEPKTQEMMECLNSHGKLVGRNPCVVNRICWLFEDIFNGYLSKVKNNKVPKYDYTILKSNVEYSKKNFEEISALYDDYRHRLDDFQKRLKNEKIDVYESAYQKKLFVDRFKRKCSEICTNEKELCDILLDICYKSEKTKQFAWNICGDVILNNLLAKSGGIINYPQLTDEEGDFEYCGEHFVMKEKKVGENYYDYTE